MYSRVEQYTHYAKLAGNDLEQYTMPVPSFNVINGGLHAGNKVVFQVSVDGRIGTYDMDRIRCDIGSVHHDTQALLFSSFGTIT